MPTWPRLSPEEIFFQPQTMRYFCFA